MEGRAGTGDSQHLRRSVIITVEPQSHSGAILTRLQGCSDLVCNAPRSLHGQTSVYLRTEGCVKWRRTKPRPQDLGIFLTVVPTGTEAVTLSLLRVPRA